MRTVTRAAALGAFATLTAACSAPLHAMRHMTDRCVDVPLLDRIPLPGRDVGNMRFGTIATRFVAKPVPYALMTPDRVDPRSITRVAYVLPGRGGVAWATMSWLGYAANAQRLVRAGAPPFAVLAIDPGETYFHPRRSGDDHLAFVEHDVRAFARTVLAPRLREALVGYSMGGYGALLEAERFPQRYRSVAVASPALFRSYNEENRAIGDGFDGAAQFARYDVFAGAARLADVPVRIRVGYADPFLTAVEAFAKVCPHADVAYVEHGCHDDGFWRVTARELLAFTAAHLA